jgi:hypothetical protein
VVIPIKSWLDQPGLLQDLFYCAIQQSSLHVEIRCGIPKPTGQNICSTRETLWIAFPPAAPWTFTLLPRISDMLIPILNPAHVAEGTIHQHAYRRRFITPGKFGVPTKEPHVFVVSHRTSFHGRETFQLVCILRACCYSQYCTITTIASLNGTYHSNPKPPDSLIL